MLYIVFLAWILGHAFVGENSDAFLAPIQLIYLFVMGLCVYGIAVFFKKIHVLKYGLARSIFYVSTFIVAMWHAQYSLSIQLKDRVLIAQDTRVLIYVKHIDELNAQSIQQRMLVFNPTLKTTAVWDATLPKKKFSKNPFRLGHYYWVKGKVYPVHGYAVPYTFEQEKWALQQGVMGKLHVESFEEASLFQLKSEMLYRHFFIQQQQLWPRFLLFLQHKRLEYRHFIAQQHFTHAGLMLALLSADESLISPETKQLFQYLGIQHLLAISGPHVLVFAMLLSIFCHYIIIWLCPNLYLKWPKIYVLSIPLLLGTLLYSGFVGFEVPALRTLTTVILFSIFSFFKYRISASLLTLLSASIFLLIEPLSVLSAAFWLSYTACFVLLFIYEKFETLEHVSIIQRFKHLIYHFFYSQLYIFLALTPITLWFFHQMSWLAPLGNAVAIPLIGILIVPLNIFSACIYGLSPTLSLWFFGVVDHFVSVLIFMLSYLQSFGIQPQYYALTGWKILILVVIVLLLLLPKGVLPRWYIVPCIIALYLPTKQNTPFLLSILDVGQGQAVFVNTSQQRMMIDTGGHINESSFSLAKALLIPFLMKQGVSELDQVLLTHLDVDHSGAFEQLQQYMKINMLRSNQRPDHLNSHTAFSYCHAGQRDIFNDLTIDILWPLVQNLVDAEKMSNEYSCVVYLTYQPKQGRPKHILIMGDTSEFAERDLMIKYPNLAVDVLVLGHHGSKYSSSLSFLRHYQPKMAIASAGYMNRYGHPHVEVQARLKQLNIPLMVTRDTGTIDLTINDQGILTTDVYRKHKLWLVR
ncbi:DNA internalization-related competence protein ComEC/Rec2 [Acinetobacter sp. B5B]|uniref:DNA internalization-related competence protein ComEC/Rec2 n=1 Tax=Acinetobacter baretiae TaxID=2605383 RepID=UPI0018C2098A|nr:DNA internalization-related competence protein ComEC/Rec2 [Acinetobacter baretiae]MBF7682061.1 DNA internalization-related competence protein ComEC/Rec2 [Acinetobacter baretiae]